MRRREARTCGRGAVVDPPPLPSAEKLLRGLPSASSTAQQEGTPSFFAVANLSLAGGRSAHDSVCAVYPLPLTGGGTVSAHFGVSGCRSPKRLRGVQMAKFRANTMNSVSFHYCPHS